VSLAIEKLFFAFCALLSGRVEVELESSRESIQVNEARRERLTSTSVHGAVIHASKPRMKSKLIDLP
jgi:hypothetical protein